MTAPDTVPSDGAHPRGLLILAGVEFWERFSYYGLLANLVFFLVWHLDLDRETAFRQMAAFTALVFLCPLVGGLLADRWFGPRRLVAAGLVMLLSGHGLMAFMPLQTAESLVTSDGARLSVTRPVLYPSTGETGARSVALPDGPATLLSVRPANDGSDDSVLSLRRADTSETSLRGRIERREDRPGRLLFHLALALVAAGIGFMKANISALVGALYGASVARRDQGFTLFYMAINAGAVAGSAVCGWLAFRFGWELGFGAAGGGILVALVLLRAGRHLLLPAAPAKIARPATAAAAAGAALTLACWGLLGAPRLVEGLLDLAALAGIGFVLAQSRKLDKRQRLDLLVLAVLMASSVLFWTLQGQSPGSLNLFTAEWVDLHFLGLDIPAPVMQFLPMAFIVAFAAPVGALWRFLEKRRLSPSPPALSALGILQMGISFLLLVLGIALMPEGGKVDLIWLALPFLLQGTGELFLSPIGLSTITRLSPPNLTATMLGLWFLSTAYAQKLGAFLGQATVAIAGATPVERLGQYFHVYLRAGEITCAVGAALLLLAGGLALLGRRIRPLGSLARTDPVPDPQRSC